MPSPFEILYLSENVHVCLLEIEALLGSPRSGFVSRPRTSLTAIAVQVSLQQIVDLTSVTEQKRLGVTAQELTGDWDGYEKRNPSSSVPQPTGTAPTQDLGEALFNTPNVEGFRTVSAKVPDQMNLIVFPQRLLKGSWVRHTTSDTPPKVHEIKGII